MDLITEAQKIVWKKWHDLLDAEICANIAKERVAYPSNFFMVDLEKNYLKKLNIS